MVRVMVGPAIESVGDDFMEVAYNELNKSTSGKHILSEIGQKDIASVSLWE